MGENKKFQHIIIFCSQGKIRWLSLVCGRTTAVLVLRQYTFLVYSTILK